MKCVEVYKELYHQEPYGVAFCPYRISPLGAHIDHQYGKINGLAIDKGIHMAYHPKQNGVVELQSLNFPKRAQFFVSAVPEEKQGDWADHLRGAAKMLGEKYRLKVGLSGIIEGSLPIGGLSSSAAVIICFLSALCKVNGIHLEPMEMILTAKAAENQYVGVSCGKLDQSCEVLSKKNHLLYLDTKDDGYELIPTSEKMKPYKVAIFFSGLERSLKNSKYNLRQDECKAAAYALMGYAGMDYDTFANTRLRDVPFEVFESYKDAMFERTCLSVYLGEQLSPDGWKCTMVQACYLSLPLSLEGCAEALKTVEQKDKEGHDLIRYFCVPCKSTKLNGGRIWNLPEHAPEKWDKFKYYCCQDVETERDIEKKISLYPISPHEMDLYRLDQRINDRGVLVDMELVKQAIACDVMHSEKATARAYELTGCDNPNSVSQLKGWLSEQGVEIDSLSKKAVKQTMKELEKNASSNAEAIEVLVLRAKMAKSSVKKYEAAARSVCKDGRIHGCFQFMGANRTGRWAGRLVQLQNLPQNHIETLAEARTLVRMGEFGVLEMIYENTPDVLSQLIRTMFIPKPGCRFIVADFSQIEARVLAWMAGEQWRLDVFREGKDTLRTFRGPTPRRS